jgi:hypothetical protein
VRERAVAVELLSSLKQLAFIALPITVCKESALQQNPRSSVLPAMDLFHQIVCVLNNPSNT